MDAPTPKQRDARFYVSGFNTLLVEVRALLTLWASSEGRPVESFSTTSGSTYEVDLEAQRIRRVGNSAGRPPTPAPRR